MAFVRKRKAGDGLMGLGEATLSTTLVESYRDAEGRPRQRVLASMHGEKTTLSALAKVAAIRANLREEKADLDKAQAQLAPIYEDWMQAIGTGHRLTKDDRRKCDRVVKMRQDMQIRAGEIESRLAKLNREGAAIKKHCEASDDEIQTAIRIYKAEVKKAETGIVGGEFMMSEQKRHLRRLLS